MSAPLNTDRLPAIGNPRAALGSLVAVIESSGFASRDVKLCLATLALFAGGVDGEAAPTLRATREECVVQWRRIVARVRPEVVKGASPILRGPRLALLDDATGLFVRAMRVREGA